MRQGPKQGRTVRNMMAEVRAVFREERGWCGRLTPIEANARRTFLRHLETFVISCVREDSDDVYNRHMGHVLEARRNWKEVEGRG